MNFDTSKRAREIDHHLHIMLEEGANEHGYRLDKGQAAGWRFYQSASAPGEIALAGLSTKGPFFLSLTHEGVTKDVGFAHATPCARNFAAGFGFETRDELYDAISEVYRKSMSLPTMPLGQYERQTRHLGDTEKEQLTKQRIGQDIFRDSLLDYWNHACPMTGIIRPELLRASHIIPWAKCDSDADRLNVYNGLLLSSLWDTAFDCGLLGFDDDGSVLLSAKLGDAERRELNISSAPPLPLRDEHRSRLDWHRQNLFKAG